jgi:hypothetical protein
MTRCVLNSKPTGCIMVYGGQWCSLVFLRMRATSSTSRKAV